MWKFIVDNASAVQAVAAIFNVLASLGLLYATGIYVRHTRRLAEFAKTQAEQSTLTSAAQRRAAELSAVSQYFLQGDTPAAQELRSRLWNTHGESPDRNDASQIASYWHFWGLMVRQGLLPFWVFEGSSGVRVTQYYSKLEQFIANERKTGNKHYAEHFEWLRDRIADRQQHE